MQLNLSNIAYTYPGAVEPALRGITATFPAGWTGIIGDNGGGKTTLALVACGVLQPDAGSVSPALVARYCAQDATVPPGDLEAFACAYDGLAVRLRRDLRIDDEWAWRYDTLSSGQQKRLQVACALWAEPDLLVMDEPTNHVDATTRDAIASALASFRGVGLLISHDRTLLDQLCTQCLLVTNGTATMRPGGYSQAFAQAELERDSALHARETARKEKVRIEREAQRRREEASRAASRRSGKNFAKHDSDAREKRMRFIISGQDGKVGKLSSRMEGRLATVASKLDAVRVEKRYDADIWLDASPSRRKVLLRRAADSIPLGENMVLRTPALYLGNTDHVGLVGDNGSGKSTLVKRIVAELAETTRCLYVPQEPTADQKREVLQAMHDLPSAERGRVLSIVAQLNSEPERVLEGAEVSPGEMRKLMLALGILKKPELIVMDEPTNHLDLGSTEALERVLSAFPGALLLVSHDAALVRGTTDITWSIEPAAGGYELTVR